MLTINNEQMASTSTGKIAPCPKAEPAKEQQPPVQKVKGPCVKAIRFKDRENRWCSPDRVLEIVPPEMSSNDTITFVAEGDKQCGCSGPSYQLDGSAKIPVSCPASISGLKEALSIVTAADISRAFHFSPREAPLVFTCDANGAEIASGQLRIYPNDTQKINWNATDFFKKHPDVAAIINDLNDFVSKVSGKTVDPAKGLNVNYGLMYVQVPVPKITFSFDGKWTEYPKSDATRYWEAYYGFGVKLEGTLFSVKLKVDLIGALSYLPQLAPFKPIYDEVWDAIKAKLPPDNGPPFYFGIGGDLTGAVQIERKPDWKPAGSIKLTGDMFLGVHVEAGIIEAEMESSTSIAAKLEVKGEGEAANLYYSAFTFEGIKGTVSVIVDTGWVGKWGFEKEVDILQGSDDGWPINGKVSLIG